MLRRFTFVALAFALSACNGSTNSTPPTTPPETASLQPIAFYSFKGKPGDGAQPKSALLSHGAVMYGTTYWGGTHNAGTLYSIGADGQEKVVHNFGDFTDDGAHPVAAVTASGDRLYGTTYRGGGPVHPLCLDGCGTVYTYDLGIGRFRVLHDFKTVRTPTDTARPWAGVLPLNGILYGATDPGDRSPFGHGAIYELTTEGKSYAIVHTFGGFPDGSGAKGDLVPLGNALLGTTERGGNADKGTVYRFALTGANYGKVYDFHQPSSSEPAAGLFLYGDTYYGTTYWGGSSNCGTIYSVGPKGYRLIYSFKCKPDGEKPLSKLVAVNGLLYGTTYWGGTDGDGTIFAIAPDGTNYQHFSFPSNGGARPEGAHPGAGLTLHDGKLYGTALFGGAHQEGLVFRVTPLPGNPTPTPAPTATPTATPAPTPTPSPTPPPGHVTFASIHSFAGNPDGQYPHAGLTAANGALYGTAYRGGALGKGTIYTISPSGDVQAVYAFGHPQGGDGPAGEVLVINGEFYGTTYLGGSSVREFCFPIGCGTLYKISRHPHRETVLVNFDGATMGQNPTGPLVQIGTTLVGTTYIGGLGGGLKQSNDCPPDCGLQCPLGCGVLYSVSLAGTNFADLHHFDFDPHKGKNDGAYPKDGVTLVGNVLYGTTAGGGKASNVTDHDGTLFKTDTAGGSYQILYNFNGREKGSFPEGGVIAVNGNLYGTAYKGGKNCFVRGCGVVFEIDLSGRRAEEKVLYQFGGFPDGAYPQTRLLYYRGMLYGTTTVGGSKDLGTVFRISPSGTNYQIVHNFLGPDGAHPKGALIESGGALYGTTESGGKRNLGTVFKLTFEK